MRNLQHERRLKEIGITKSGSESLLTLQIFEVSLFKEKPIALLDAEALKQIPGTVTLGK
jgi:hypothetical protein